MSVDSPQAHKVRKLASHFYLPTFRSLAIYYIVILPYIGDVSINVRSQLFSFDEAVPAVIDLFRMLQAA